MKNIVLLKSKPKQGGGLEKVASRIADAFTARGDNVTILSPENKWFKVECFERAVQKWVKHNPADIIFGMDRNRYQTHFRAGNGSHHAFLKSRIASEGRIKYYTCLLNPTHRKILQIEKVTFEHPGLKKLFVNSHMVRNEILDRYIVDPNKIIVLHNGVEWDEMETDFNAWPENKKTDRFTFLFIGNGYLRKGLPQLLQAFALLNNKNANLIVVGKDKNIAHYKKMATQLGLSEKVQFLGPQSNIRPLYQQADALVIPSFYDPFANVTVEALAMGVRVISSKSNGGSEILTPSNGQIIDDLLYRDSIRDALTNAMDHPKTPESAAICRASVQHLNYPNQLKTLIDHCYE